MRPKSSETSRNRLCRTITTRPSQLSLNLQHRLREPLRLPLNSFTYYWTLSSKFFSTFPHGTCPLSVSCQYLALDGVYHPLWAAFSNNPTPETCRATVPAASKGLTPAVGDAPIRRTWAAGGRDGARPKRYIAPRPLGRGLQRWALPASLAVTRGILVSFFSSA